MVNQGRREDWLKPSKRFFPFQRDDSQHMVFGPATSEAVDSFGTVFALDATREALAEYEQWRTLRGMHAPIAAGTVPALELERATIQGGALQIGARVVDAAEWAKVTSSTYKGFSIGFDPLDGRFEMRDGTEVFIFTKYRLIEISLVDRPSNPDCIITLYRAQSPYLLAAQEADWTFDWQNDFEAIRAKGGAQMLSDAFAWCATDAAEDPAGYALPVARLEEGADTLTLNLYALRMAVAGLNGARANLAVPDSDREAVQSRLTALFKLFNENPPEWQRAAGPTRKETPMNEKELESGLKAFFGRVLGFTAAGQRAAGDPPPAKDPPAKVRMEKALHESLTRTAEALKAALTATSPANVRALADGMDALLAAAEVAPDAKTPATEPTETDKRLAKLEADNAALTGRLDEALKARKSTDTVEVPEKQRSPYGGAFVRS